MSYVFKTQNIIGIIYVFYKRNISYKSKQNTNFNYRRTFSAQVLPTASNGQPCEINWAENDE